MIKEFYVDQNANKFKWFPMIKNPYYKGDGTKKKPFLDPNEAMDAMGKEGGIMKLGNGTYDMPKINKNNVAIHGTTDELKTEIKL